MTTITLMDERDLQNTICDPERGIAKLYGWLVMHQRPARTAKGWRTAIQGDAGFPDLVLVRPARHELVTSNSSNFRPPRLLFVELKAKRGRLTDGQRQWMEALVQIPFVEVLTWTPDDLLSGRIEKALT